MQNADDQRRALVLRFTLFGLIATILAATFLSRFVLVSLLIVRLGLPLLLACAALVAVAGTGAAALRWLERIGGERITSRRSLAFLIVTGYPIFGTLCFLAALLSTSRIVMSVVLLLMIAVAARMVRPILPAAPGALSAGPATIAGLMILTGALLPVLGMAQLPASTLDELAYHLAVPQAWVVEGRVVDLPLLSHSYFPMGTESADLPFLAILGTDGAIASHFLHLFIAIAVVFLIHEWLSRRVSASSGVLYVAAIVTTPALLLTAGWSWNDWAVIGAAVALLVALDDHLREFSRGSAAAVSLALAAGMLTKYTFYPLAAGLVLAAIFASSEVRSSIRNNLSVAFAGLFAGSVFLIRNIILTGNPFAPFLGEHAPSVSHFRDAGGVLATAASYIFDGSLIDESLGVTILILGLAAIPAWAAIRAERFLSAVWIVTLVSCGILYALGPSSRILLPWLVALALVGAAGLDRTVTAGLHRRLIQTLLAVLCSAQLLLVWFFAARLDPFATLSGRDTDETYLARHRESFAGSMMVNQRLTPDSKTLAVGTSELFWFTVSVRGGGNFDGPRVAAYLDARSSDDLIARLRYDGFTHLAIYPAGIRSAERPESILDDERMVRLPPHTLANLQGVTGSHAVLVAAEGGAMLYALR